MSYRVEYGVSGESVFINTDKLRRKKQSGRIICAMLVVAILVYGIVNGWIWDFLFPGHNEITKAAAENMIAEIQEGEPVADAVTAFCKEIVQNGQ